MNRRHFLGVAMGIMAFTLAGSRVFGAVSSRPETIEKIIKTEREWRASLTRQQFRVLRREDTERAFSSSLNSEKRTGTYLCAGCGLPLFTSAMKYDSGTGWPSFFSTIPGTVETKLDFIGFYPRYEYHCRRCGGHQGHVFNDGPRPSGQRWCNNGVALRFMPA